MAVAESRSRQQMTNGSSVARSNDLSRSSRGLMRSAPRVELRGRCWRGFGRRPGGRPRGHVQEDRWGCAGEEDAGAEREGSDDVGREDRDAASAGGDGAAAVGAAAPVADLFVAVAADGGEVLKVSGLG